MTTSDESRPTGMGRPMDHGRPDEAILRDVWAMLRCDCDEEHRARMLECLSGCPPCETAYAMEKRLRELVGRSCCETAPDGLRERLMDRLRTLRIEETTYSVGCEDGRLVRRTVRRVWEGGVNPGRTE